jgi:hypothetical protein
MELPPEMQDHFLRLFERIASGMDKELACRMLVRDSGLPMTPELKRRMLAFAAPRATK